MYEIVMGVIAFIFMFIFDVMTLKNRLVLKKIFGILGLGVFIYSTIIVISHSTVTFIPFFVRIISGFFCLFFVLLLIYSLFLELPFMKTYGEKSHNNSLVDRGTYALCRHPGVLWFGFSFLFLFLTLGKIEVLFAGIIWTICDIIYVILQEKFIFHKMFTDYFIYVNTTPMLIPNIKSIRRSIQTLGGLK